jgi:hypothetical protein
MGIAGGGGRDRTMGRKCSISNSFYQQHEGIQKVTCILTDQCRQKSMNLKTEHSTANKKLHESVMLLLISLLLPHLQSDLLSVIRNLPAS